MFVASQNGDFTQTSHGISKYVTKIHQYHYFSYPLKPYLLTPVLEPQTASEEAYDRSLGATRATIERAFGVFKRRFRLYEI